MAQDSAYTSLNQVPAFFKSKTFQKIVADNKIKQILDVGGGKFDKATDFLRTQKIQNLVYDPFNRTRAHNRLVRNIFMWEIPYENKMVTCLNVLNVIQDDKELDKTIKLCAEATVAKGCITVFQIYEGDKSGIKSTTTVQRNQRTKDYLNAVAKHFPYARVVRNLIIAY